MVLWHTQITFELKFFSLIEQLCMRFCKISRSFWGTLRILETVLEEPNTTFRMSVVTILLMVDILVYWSHKYQFAISYNTVGYRRRRWVTILGRWVFKKKMIFFVKISLRKCFFAFSPVNLVGPSEKFVLDPKTFIRESVFMEKWPKQHHPFKEFLAKN